MCVPCVTLSLSARVLTRLRGVRSVRAYAAAGIISSCRDARALRLTLWTLLVTCMPPQSRSLFAARSVAM